MKTKRIVSTILVLSLAAMLCACGEKPAQTPDTSEPQVSADTATPAPTAAPAATEAPAPTAVPEPTEKPAPTATAAPLPSPFPTPTPTPSVKPAAEAFVVENADGKTAADLSDDWTIKKYDNNWVDCGASIGVDRSYSEAAGECFVAKCWNNYTVFRYSHDYSVNEGYSQIEFDAKGDDIASAKLQLMSRTYGVYATIDLGKLSSKWCHYVVPMYMEQWKMNYNGSDMPLSNAVGAMGMSELYEMIPFFDQINLIFSGQTPNGANANIYLDNLEFVYKDYDVFSATEMELADTLLMNFDDVNGWGDAYPSKKWTRFKYTGNAWQQFETGINDYNSSNSNSKLIGLTTGWSTNFMYRYIGDGNGLGSFDHFSVDLGTYRSSQTMKVKLACVTESGETIYLMGTADAMAEIAAGTDMTTYSFDFGKRTEVREFYICAYSKDNNGDHLYVDNIYLH